MICLLNKQRLRMERETPSTPQMSVSGTAKLPTSGRPRPTPGLSLIHIFMRKTEFIEAKPEFVVGVKEAEENVSTEELLIKEDHPLSPVAAFLPLVVPALLITCLLYTSRCV